MGGFSYSEGLEAAVEAGLVTDEATAAAWLGDQLRHAQGESDIAVVHATVAAARAGDAVRVAALDTWVKTTRETAELRLQTDQMGRSLAGWLAQRGSSAWQPQSDGAPQDREPDGMTGVTPGAAGTPWPAAPSYPVAFGLAGARTAAAADAVAQAYAFAWSENQVQAAVKAVPLGQSAGQRILEALAARIPDVVAHAAALTDATRQAFTPMLAIRSAQHEHQSSRLFRS